MSKIDRIQVVPKAKTRMESRTDELYEESKESRLQQKNKKVKMLSTPEPSVGKDIWPELSLMDLTKQSSGFSE